MVKGSGIGYASGGIEEDVKVVDGRGQRVIEEGRY